ncbi:MAG: Fe-S cluster assembly ATPase SufC [Microgenomates group bacterium]
MLTLKNLLVSIESKKILKNINYTFEPGKVYAIMGPNGSGKSTLASTVMGHPIYSVSKTSKIMFEGENITEMEPNERSNKGIFLSFQTPMALTGVTIYQFMRYALTGKMDALKIRQGVQKFAKKLRISEDLLSRSLNDGFSGGEKKKMEVLQAALLDPKLAFFDEIDTGVDVDALRSIAKFIQAMRTPQKTFVIITHYNRILKYLKPDKILVLKNGQIVKEGDFKLAQEIEKKGYDAL